MHIDSYRFGEIIIDGKRYSGDVLIVEGRIIDWWRKQGHLLQIEDLEEVWGYKPDILIVGQGASGLMKIGDKVIKKCNSLGIKLISKMTSKAVEEINRTESAKKVACGLHLTC